MWALLLLLGTYCVLWPRIDRLDPYSHDEANASSPPLHRWEMEIRRELKVAQSLTAGETRCQDGNPGQADSDILEALCQQFAGRGGGGRGKWMPRGIQGLFSQK